MADYEVKCIAGRFYDAEGNELPQPRSGRYRLIERPTDAAIDELTSLVYRLWNGGIPDTASVAAMDAFAATLPEAQRAALNASLGQNYGPGQYWDDPDDPICVAILDVANRRQLASFDAPSEASDTEGEG